MIIKRILIFLPLAVILLLAQSYFWVPTFTDQVKIGPLTFDGKKAVGTLTNADFFVGEDCVSLVGRPVDNVAALAFAMREGLIYVNLHTAENLPGEVRGQLIEQ